MHGVSQWALRDKVFDRSAARKAGRPSLTLRVTMGDSHPRQAKRQRRCGQWNVMGKGMVGKGMRWQRNGKQRNSISRSSSFPCHLFLCPSASRRREFRQRQSRDPGKEKGTGTISAADEAKQVKVHNLRRVVVSPLAQPAERATVHSPGPVQVSRASLDAAPGLRVEHELRGRNGTDVAAPRRGRPRVVAGSENAGVSQCLGLARGPMAARIPGVPPRSAAHPGLCTDGLPGRRRAATKCVCCRIIAEERGGGTNCAADEERLLLDRRLGEGLGEQADGVQAR